MVTGTHCLLYSSDPDADRTFFRDVLGFRSVDAGHGWLIFALPPAELAVHPVEGTPGSVRTDHELLRAELYLMCDDLDTAVARLAASQVRCSGVESAQWGRHTTVQLPSGGRIGLYQPTHPTAIGA